MKTLPGEVRLYMKKLKNIAASFIGRLSGASFFESISILGLLSLILNFILEATCRKSIISAAVYMITSPLGYLLGTLIIMFTLTLCLFIKRRSALILLICAAWASLGIANAVVLTYRTNPLAAIDFLIVRSMTGMTGAYFSLFEVILACIGIAAVIVLLVFMIIKCPPSKVDGKKTGASLLAILLSGGILNLITLNTNDMNYGTSEIDKAYRDLGFVYCFSTSIVSHGVDKPDGYGSNDPDSILDNLESEHESSSAPGDAIPDTLPNVIVLQLESFIDLSGVKGITFSENPTPHFSRLKNEGVSGYLRVPHVGGGTANVEFEILTGMNLDHFGFGEYPYTTVLRTTACESLATNLKSVGYTAHAMHNHIAEFYDRDLAYASLGFDTFTPIEMMTDVSKNPLGWAKDEVLIGEILSALDTSDGPDIVFAVSVQGHGKYPDESVYKTNGISDNYTADTNYTEGTGITANNIDDSAVRCQFEFYANQTHEMDAVIGKLKEALEKSGEPYALIVYGDHLPALPMDEKDLKNPDLYETEYAICTNLDLSGLTLSGNVNELDKDLEAYMLSAYIQKLFGFNSGKIAALHRHELDTGESCDDLLKSLEYEQLYDDTETEYLPTRLSFGTRDVTVESYSKTGNSLIIKGSGFNEYSTVKIDGIKRTPELIDSTTLVLDNVYFGFKTIDVIQITDRGTELAYAVFTNEN